MNNLKVSATVSSATAILLASTLALTGCQHVSNIPSNATSDSIAFENGITKDILKNAYLYKNNEDKEYRLVSIYRISKNFFQVNDLYYYADYLMNSNTILQEDNSYELYNYNDNVFDSLDDLGYYYYPIYDDLISIYGDKYQYTVTEIENYVNEKKEEFTEKYYHLKKTLEN